MNRYHQEGLIKDWEYKTFDSITLRYTNIEGGFIVEEPKESNIYFFKTLKNIEEYFLNKIKYRK